MKQAGWNLDTLCYPDSDCRHVGGAPEGYRWFYVLDSDLGSTPIPHSGWSRELFAVAPTHCLARAPRSDP